MSTSGVEHHEMTCRAAFGEALRQLMQADPSVFVAGEGIRADGGAFGLFDGLHASFGGQRVVDTPISEQAMVGLGIGSALSGLRPVIDLMFMDFALVALDQIANQAAKARFRFGREVPLPLTLTMTVGSGRSLGAHHSQSLEALLCHIPGLKVVMPSNARDAMGLLAASIVDDDPVVYINHAGLLDRASPCPAVVPAIALGSASAIRPGSDLTLVTWGAMVVEALRAASVLASEGIDVEIIDVRTLAPIDHRTILESVQRTNHCVVAHEAVRTGGLGAEIAAEVQEHAFDYLDAPVARVAAPDTPVPFGPELERAWLPSAADIADQIRTTLTHE